jgi:hypothetical protein
LRAETDTSGKARRVAGSAIAFFVLLTFISVGRPGTAAESIGRLDLRHTIINWKGGPFSGPAGLPGFSNPRPEVCATNCERRSVEIKFPLRTWQRPRDGVMIAFKHLDPNDAINLYVYDPAGKQVGASTGLDADGQAVFLPRPRNGVYTIIVNVTELANSNVTYSGYAALRRDPCQAGNCLLLPKLQPASPFNFHLTGLPVAPSTFLGFPFPFSVGPATPRSCWLDETASQGAQRCLRIANEIDNVGDGPLILRFKLTQPLTNPGVNAKNEYLTGCEMQQLIERDDGTAITRSAGPCVYHLIHGHFHYENMATFGLYAVRPDGRTGGVLRVSRKQGFCLTDGRAVGFKTQHFDGRGYWFPNCNLPSSIDGNDWVRMGISTGWGDVYAWDVPAQYIEISGIRDGVYDVISIANPLGQILEAGKHARAQARSRICIRGSTVTELLAAATKCSQVRRAG